MPSKTPAKSASTPRTPIAPKDRLHLTRGEILVELAREAPAAADVVVPIPDSGVPAAIGFSQESGLPFELGIIRNHYVGRTFIQPTQSVRELGVRMKHSANRAAIEGRWATTMRFFAGPTLLVIDELGYLPLPAEAASALFQVVSQRYLRTSIVITTNRGVGAWGDILGDTTVAAAMLDRLLHRSVVVNLDGESYRLRDHQARSNKLRATTTGTRQPLS